MFKRTLIKGTLLALVCGLVVPSAAQAKPPHNRVEQAQDRREARDDRRDLAELEALLTRYDAARNARHFGRRLTDVEDRIRRHLREELAENRTEVARAKRESRREARAETALYTRRVALARELNGLLGDMRPASVSRKRTLLTELIQVARTEIRDNRRDR